MESGIPGIETSSRRYVSKTVYGDLLEGGPSTVEELSTSVLKTSFDFIVRLDDGTNLTLAARICGALWTGGGERVFPVNEVRCSLDSRKLFNSMVIQGFDPAATPKGRVTLSLGMLAPEQGARANSLNPM